MIGKYSVTIPILKLLTKNLEQCSELRKGRSDPIFPRSYIDAVNQGLTSLENVPGFLNTQLQ